jgi:hypothetical protein
MNKAKALSILICWGALNGAVLAEDSRDVAKRITSAIARVGLVWPIDKRYEDLHKELSEKFDGTPPWEQFKAEERWIVATAHDPMLLAGTFKSRSKADMALQPGDIVVLKVGYRRSAKVYEDLTTVSRILCKTGAPEYEECVKANPVARLDKDGKVIQPDDM